MQKVAVVILNWNGVRYLQKFLPFLVQNTILEGAGLYVADNCSSDNSIEFVRQNYPQVRLIQLDKNYGFAAGYNLALDQINAEYFVLLNSDVEVSPGWLEPLFQTMENDPTIAAVMPKILDYNNRVNFEYAGAAGGFLDKFGYPFCRGRIFNELEADNGQYDDIKSIFWASGACLMVRSELYKKAGGLDSDFFAHMEEIDLCWRLKNMGFTIKVNPASVVYHVGGGTLSHISPFKTFLNFRNNLYLLYKNVEKGRFSKLLFVRLLLDGVAGFKFLFGLEFRHFIAVIKAHFSFYSTVSKMRPKRKHNIENLFKTYEHSEIYKGSIVTDFFIKKRKKFSDLNYK